jgi:signal transduction histidine kinase
MTAGEDSAVRVSLPDRAGRLRLAASCGRPVATGRLRSARRREALEHDRATTLVLSDPPGSTLVILPLVATAPVGVVEIVGATATLEERMPTIVAFAEVAACALRSAAERAAAERTLRGMDAALGLAVELLRAKDAETALRKATNTIHRHLRTPVIGCLPTSETPAVIRGLAAERRAEVREILDGLSAAPGAAWVLATRLGSPLGGDVPVLIGAGRAILVVDGTTGTAARDFLRAIGRLLAEALERIDDVALAQLRTESLDLGIAWTAHELRGPLLGARVALDHVSSGGADARSELIRRTRDELAQLVDVVDPLLRWSAGVGALHRRPVDLSRVVREAAESCAAEDRHRVSIDAPESVSLRADPVQLRVAVANLVRNALAYSGPHAPVHVTVAEHGGSASIRVRDQGPGVPPDEREIVFDPFARGRAANRVRGGKGLGLFIARRIVEAHGGTLRLLPATRGAEFCMEVPVAQAGEGRHRSAS